MRPNRLAAVAGALLTAGGCAAPAHVPPAIEKPAGPLTLPRAVELCLRNNPDIQAAAERVAVARGAIDEAVSSYWPVLQFVESFTMAERPSQAFAFRLDQRRFSLPADLPDPGITTDWRTGLGASLTLYDGGRRRARVQATAAEAQSAAAEAERVRRDLALEVARAYVMVLKARETASDQETSLKTLDEHLRITEAREGVGAARRSDVLAVRVRVAETREAKIAASNAAERALAGLRVLLGLEVDEPIELAGPVPVGDRPRGDLRALLDLAKAQRWELVRASKEVEAAEARLREALATYHPDVTLFGGFGFDAKNPAHFEYGNWSWGFSFVKDLVAILRAPHRGRQAAAARDAAHAAARKALLEVQLDVKNALLDGEESDARFEVAAQAVELAEETLRLVEAEYRAGAATVTKLLDAELALTQARTRLSSAAHDRALSRIALAHAVGEFPAPPEPTEERP
ncbi:MAG: TolC family protein [Planctomycetota bacterium]